MRDIVATKVIVENKRKNREVKIIIFPDKCNIKIKEFPIGR